MAATVRCAWFSFRRTTPIIFSSRICCRNLSTRRVTATTQNLQISWRNVQFHCRLADKTALLSSVTCSNAQQKRWFSAEAAKPLTLDDVRRRVLDVCKAFERLNAENLTEDSHFLNDLGLDSLDQVELVMAMEDEFGFEIPDVDAEKLMRPADVVKYIANHEEIHK